MRFFSLFSRKHFLVFLSLICLALQTQAGDFIVNGTAARAQSMQTFTAVADDPSAIYYNPAGITQLKDNQIETSVAYVMQDMDFKNSLNNASSNSDEKALGPSLFMTSGKFDPIFFGLGIYAPFARRLDYTANDAVFNMTQNSLIQRVDYVPTIAGKYGEHIAFGVGLVGSRIDASSNVFGGDEIAHGYGATAQGGVLISWPKCIKIGVTYRGPMNAHLDGDGRFSTPFAYLTGGFDTQFHFPGVLSTGVSAQVLPPLLLTLGWDYEMWSYLSEVRRNYSNPLINSFAVSQVDAKNSSDYRAGLIFRANQNNEFRAGVAYLQAAVPTINYIPAQPDYVGSGGSVGYSFYCRNLRFDAGYEYGYLKRQRSLNPLIPGIYHGNLYTLLAGLKYTFA